MHQLKKQYQTFHPAKGPNIYCYLLYTNQGNDDLKLLAPNVQNIVKRWCTWCLQYDEIHPPCFEANNYGNHTSKEVDDSTIETIKAMKNVWNR